MSRPDPIGADRRARQVARRLPADAACAVCGERNPQVLTGVGRSILERHEPGGRKNHLEPRVVLCLNHHRIETMRQLAAGVDLEGDPERVWLEKLGPILLGIGLFLKTAGETLIEHARRLETFLELLDRHFPAWRTLPGMH
jgi:hypothetical protein